MREKFENWMKDKEGKKSGVIASYALAINRISEHYTNEIGVNTDIYQIKDLRLLKEICTQYRRGGKYEEFGDEKHGLHRAAITAYVRYYEDTATVKNIFDEKKFVVSEGEIVVKKNSTGRKIISINLLMEEVEEVKE
jgi:hypothetical protein